MTTTTLREPSLLTSRSVRGGAADAVIVCVRPKGRGIALQGPALAGAAFADAILESLAAIRTSASAGAIAVVPSPDPARCGRVVAVGLGGTAGHTEAERLEQVRSAVGAAVRSLTDATTVAILAPADDADTVAATAMGAQLGAYRFTKFRSGKKAAAIRSISVMAASAKDKEVVAAVREAVAIAQRVALTKDLVNTPPSHLPPKAFADAAARAGRSAGLRVQVTTATQLRTRGFGGISGVGQGSANPPRLVTLTYRHPRAQQSLAFVGKGVTFDTGGISLKPPQAMETMKSDMAGAAAVLGAITAIADLKLRVNVTAYLPMVENMPSGTATRPSDVLTMYGGKTVEVLNTDAEGRLILADCLALAVADGHEVVVDIATLTGAQRIALGNNYAGAMSNHERTRSAVVRAAESAGELLWPMPLPPQMRPLLDSTVADLKNIGGPLGGMLTAGLFLQEFVSATTKWVHLDIAGPAFNEGSPAGYLGKGATGFGVRSLVEFARQHSV